MITRVLNVSFVVVLSLAAGVVMTAGAVAWFFLGGRD